MSDHLEPTDDMINDFSWIISIHLTNQLIIPAARGHRLTWLQGQTGVKVTLSSGRNKVTPKSYDIAGAMRVMYILERDHV